jgi:hypothetical protein
MDTGNGHAESKKGFLAAVYYETKEHLPFRATRAN